MVGLSAAAVGANAEAIARSKIATKNLLTTVGLPVPRGRASEVGELDLSWEFSDVRRSENFGRWLLES